MQYSLLIFNSICWKFLQIIASKNSRSKTSVSSVHKWSLKIRACSVDILLYINRAHKRHLKKYACFRSSVLNFANIFYLLELTPGLNALEYKAGFTEYFSKFFRNTNLADYRKGGGLSNSIYVLEIRWAEFN